MFIYIHENRGVLTFFQQTQSVQYKTSCRSVDPLDELLLHHAVEGNVGQVRDEGVAHTPADARAAPEVEQGQVGETLKVGETAVCQLAAACRHREIHFTEKHSTDYFGK